MTADTSIPDRFLVIGAALLAWALVAVAMLAQLAGRLRPARRD